MCKGSFNSEGLPNLGVEYYTSTETVTTLQTYSKPYIVSLSGLCLDDNLEMIETAMQKEGISAIELNLACPNIPGKPIIAYDFEEMERVLGRVVALPSFARKPLGVKLPPYFDMPHFERAAAVLAKFPLRFVTCTNTIGNALFVDVESESAMIVPKSGLGGLGGGYIKQTALANVFMISQKLEALGRSDIDVVGVGGVCSGADAFELILCGAKAVQVGTCFWTEGPVCFERIAAELLTIMQAKGYRSIEDFRGKLRPYTKKASSKSQEGVNKLDAKVKHVVTAVWHLYAVIAILAVVIAYLIALGPSGSTGLQ
jgi:dihydroorotate dehydrogenase (fumarate)